MKTSTRAIRRANDAHVSAEVFRDEIVIPLPDPRLLRLLARSVFLAVFLLSLPWLRSAVFTDFDDEIFIRGGNSSNDELFFMPKLLHDMKLYGMIKPHGRSLFLGNPGIHASLLRFNGVSCLPGRKISLIGSSQSLDFVFLVAGGFNDGHFRFIDPAIRVGGVAAFRIGDHPVKPFNLPANYRMIYIQNIGRTIIAVKKLYHDNADGSKPCRRILSFLDANEDANFEQVGRTRYVSFVKYARLVFVDMGSPGGIEGEKWFRKNYLRNEEFEIVRVDLVDMPPAIAGESGTVGDWLRRNVGKEDYVVLKAEADAVEEIVKEEAIDLVDEVFLECGFDWDNGEAKQHEEKWRKRSYLECLTLFGKLSGSGVAVHQWRG